MTRWFAPFLLIAFLGAAPAMAGDPAPAASEDASRAAARHALVKTELEMAAGLASAIGAAVDGGATFSADARAAWEGARALHRDAKALHEAGKDAKAYAKAREAVKSLREPAIALYEYEPVPPGVPEAVEKHMHQIKQRMEDVAALVGDHATPETAAQWEVAKAAFKVSKDLWTSGDKREGYRKSWDTLREFDRTVRLLFPEADAAATGG